MGYNTIPLSDWHVKNVLELLTAPLWVIELAKMLSRGVRQDIDLEESNSTNLAMDIFVIYM